MARASAVVVSVLALLAFASSIAIAQSFSSNETVPRIITNYGNKTA